MPLPANYTSQLAARVVDGLLDPDGKYAEPNRLKEIIEWAIKLPYEDLKGLNPELNGLSLEEVMILRQVQQAVNGDGKAFDRVMDRLYGKPVQFVDSTNRSGTLQDILLKFKENSKVIDVPSQSRSNE